MTKLKNSAKERLEAQHKVTHLSEEESYKIHVATSKRMEKYSREYSKRDKASHIAASKVLLTS